MKNNDPNISKAENYVKKGKKTSFLQKIFSSPKERIQKTLHYYLKAIKIFEKSKNFERAAQIQILSALLEKEIFNFLESAKFYESAAENYKKNEDYEESIANLKKCIEIFYNLGKFEKSGQNLEKIGDIYFLIKKNTLAANFYKESAEIFALTRKNLKKVNFLKLKIAYIFSKFVKNKDKLREAFQIYEDFAYDSLDKNLERKKKSKKIFFKCVLLFMIFENFLKAEILFRKYKLMDLFFQNSEYAIFLKNIFLSLNESGEIYFRTINEYKKKYPLDDATEIMLEEIYNFKNQDILDEEEEYFLNLKK